MKKLTTLLFSVFLLAGCAAGSDFKPKTIQGAQCKANCARNMAMCSGSSYTCDRAASTCMASCADIDALVEKK